jgi:DNA invertase Pin-like site-specific DNA recombinase
MAGRFFASCRVSSSASVKSDISIPGQRASIRAFKKMHYPDMPWARESFPSDETAGFFIDKGVSAWSKVFQDRPGSSAILSHIKEGDVLVFHSVDRGFRNVADFANTITMLTKRGVVVRFATDDSVNFSSASGKLMGNVLASVAQYSSDIKSERIREARLMVKLGLREKVPSEKPASESVGTAWGQFAYAMLHDEKKKETSGRVFGYIRCSHVKSLESGLGLAAQEEGVIAKMNSLVEADSGLKSMGVYADEAVSAFTVPFSERPLGSQIYENLKKGDHLVVYRLDRAWRSIADCARMVDWCVKKGVHVHLAQDGISSNEPMGMVHFHTLSFVAWIESHMISKRWKETKRRLKEAGRRAEKDIPVGSKLKTVNGQKRVVADPEKIAFMGAIYELHHEYGLNADGIRTMLMLWYADVHQVRSFHIASKVPGCDTIRRRIKAYPRLKDACERQGVVIPTVPCPQNHERFYEFLHRAGRHRDMKKLLSSSQT